MQTRPLSWSGFLAKPLLGLLAAFAILQIRLDAIEFFFFDLRYRLRPWHSPSGQVELVLMDRDTVAVHKGIPSYGEQAEVLSRIIAQKPLAIAYVTPLVKMDYNEEIRGRSLSAPEGTPEERDRFLKVAASFENFFQLTDLMVLKGEAEKLQLPPPFEKVKVLSAPKTADVLQFGKDGVTRRLILDYQGEYLGHLKLAQLAGARPEGIFGRSFEVFDTQQLWIDWARPGSLPTTRFEDITRALVAPNRFTGKIVLIGDDFDKSIYAYVKTPFSFPLAMSYLEMHGNMMETLIKNSAPMRAPGWLNWLITSVIAILTIQAVFTRSPSRGLIALAVAALGVLSLGFFLFWFFGLMVSISHVLLAIFLTYYFLIPYRLIVESRRSWEYFQKNQLLQQVEELKSNFISMMSHDLKTPIARILGMTDIIRKGPLTAEQGEAVEHIRASSDDLLKFTNAVLNYAEIESRGVELKKQSRDVNELLKEVLRKHEFLARAKDITLRSELEPLFSISVDPDLIRQVFSNLIENAIKYSPKGSKILVSSEERDGKVIVQVADQGPGIPSDELPAIFMKFFRSKEAKTSPIKGSGLGLYLAKYFVELHQGRIEVESAQGQGSTFIVELPIGN